MIVPAVLDSRVVPSPTTQTRKSLRPQRLLASVHGFCMSGVYSKASIRKWRERQRRAEPAAPNDDTATATPADSQSLQQPADDAPSNLSVKRTRANGPRLTPTKRRKRYSQSVLDLGQRGVDWTTCSKCGMQYVGGSPADVQQHRASCKRLASRVSEGPAALNFSLWDDVYDDADSGGLVSFPDGSRVVAVRRGTAKNMRRAAAIDAHVCAVLGTVEEVLHRTSGGWMALFYVHGKSRRVTAYALVQPVARGRWVLLDDDGQAQLLADAPALERVMLGVRRIWVVKENRQQAHATRLLETGARFLLSSHALPPSHAAFTTPTKLGASFAVGYVRKWCNKESGGVADRRQIIVYNDNDVMK